MANDPTAETLHHPPAVSQAVTRNHIIPASRARRACGPSPLFYPLDWSRVPSSSITGYIVIRGNRLEVARITNLVDMIPHKNPAIWIDRAWLVDVNTAAGSKYIPDRDCPKSETIQNFRPTTLIEMLAQTAACYAAAKAGREAGALGHMRLAQLRDVEFFALPAPPFTIELIVEHVMDYGGKSLCIGRAQIGDRIVCTGRLYLSHGTTNA